MSVVQGISSRHWVAEAVAVLVFGVVAIAHRGEVGDGAAAVVTTLIDIPHPEAPVSAVVVTCRR